MFPSFQDRSNSLERLDTGDYTEAEYTKWLAEMRWINRMLGDARALKQTLRQEMIERANGPVSLLDIGAGCGELLKVARDSLGGTDPFLVGGDLAREGVMAVQARSAELGSVAVRCDAMHLPFEDDSFDFVICSLFLHHLTDEQVVSVLNEMGRVASRHVVAIDLHRHPMAYFLYRVFSKILLQPFTQQDGLLSILRAFRPAELQDVAAGSKLRNIEVRRSFPFRLVLSARPETAQ